MVGFSGFLVLNKLKFVNLINDILLSHSFKRVSQVVPISTYLLCTFRQKMYLFIHRLISISVSVLFTMYRFSKLITVTRDHGSFKLLFQDFVAYFQVVYACGTVSWITFGNIVLSTVKATPRFFGRLELITAMFSLKTHSNQLFLRSAGWVIFLFGSWYLLYFYWALQ